MTTHGDGGKFVRYSEFLAYAIIRRNGQEKDERTVKYYSLYSVVRHGAGRGGGGGGGRGKEQ